MKKQKKETEINAERQPFTFVRRFNIIKMSALPKLTSRFNSVLIKPHRVLVELVKLILKALRKGKALRIAETLLKYKVGILPCQLAILLIKL